MFSGVERGLLVATIAQLAARLRTPFTTVDFFVADQT